MEVVKENVTVQTGNEKMPCYLARPAGGGPYPGLVVVMEAFRPQQQYQVAHRAIRGRRLRRHLARSLFPPAQ